MAPSLRIACLFVPFFPLAARLRARPDEKDAVLIISQGNGHAMHVLAATAAAQRVGIKAGMSLPQARALYPELTVWSRDPSAERAAHEALLELAERFSPRVEESDPGFLYLDTYNEPNENFFGESLRREAKKLGLTAHIGIASSKLAARIAAESATPSAEPSPTSSSPISSSPNVSVGDLPTDDTKRLSHLNNSTRTIGPGQKISGATKLGATKLGNHSLNVRDEGFTLCVPDGEEAAFLADLSIDRLNPSAETRDILHRWGIRTIGTLAKLPAKGLGVRLGAEGMKLHALAQGRDDRPLIARPPRPQHYEGMEFEWPLLQLEAFLYSARPMLERLMHRLEKSGMACRRLDYTMKLDLKGADARSITLPAPTRDIETLLKLLALELEKSPPVDAIIGLSFAATPEKPRQVQLALFEPPALSPDEVATTLARLTALLGPGRVGSPRRVSGTRPETFQLEIFSVDTAVTSPRAKRTFTVTRVIRPAVPLEVILDEAAPQSQRFFLTRIHSRTHGHGWNIQGTVRIASGPWRVEDGWWTPEATQRDYWDVELSDGGVYRIYHDVQNDGWFADGLYD